MVRNHNFSDIDLLSSFKGGDASAFKLIYERYWQLLYVSAARVLKDEEDAKDIVQEVFASFFKKGADLEITTNLSAYLYTAVRYKVLDFISRRKVRQDHVSTLTDYISSGSVGTDRTMIERELTAEIEKEIQNLPHKMKAIFELSRKEELSHKEIAAALNISDKTVKKQISNALKVLKPRLTKYCGLMLILVIFF